MNSVVGRKYARALFDLAEAQRVTELVQKDLKAIEGLLAKQADLRRMLESLEVKAQAKEALVLKAFDRLVSPLALHFLRLVARKQRFAWWSDIVQTFSKLIEQRQGLARGIAVTSAPWDEDAMKKLAKGFSAFVGRQVELEQRVDPSILGGVAVHLDSQVYDGTYRRRLADIRDQLLSVS